MLLATMLNYMDRQALAQQATEICGDLESDQRRLRPARDQVSDMAFAVGGIVTGFAADRISPRWLYPAVLLGWSIGRFRDGLGHQLTASSRLPGAAGFFRGRSMALCTRDRAATALTPRSAAGQQHHPERGVPGRDRHAGRRLVPDHERRR